MPLIRAQIDYLKAVKAHEVNKHGASDAALLAPPQTAAPKPTYGPSELVWVIPDSSPGNNRQGGEARVLRHHTDTNMNEYYDLSYIVGMGGERKLPITAILPSAPSEAPVMASRHADATIPDDVDSLRHLVRCERGRREQAERDLAAAKQNFFLELNARQAEVTKLRMRNTGIVESFRNQKRTSENLQEAHLQHANKTGAHIAQLLCTQAELTQRLLAITVSSKEKQEELREMAEKQEVEEARHRTEEAVLRSEVNTNKAALYRAEAESTKLVMEMQHMAMSEMRAREEAEAKAKQAAARECSASAEKTVAQMQVVAVFLSPPFLCHVTTFAARVLCALVSGHRPSAAACFRWTACHMSCRRCSCIGCGRRSCSTFESNWAAEPERSGVARQRAPRYMPDNHCVHPSSFVNAALHDPVKGARAGPAGDCKGPPGAW